VYILLLMSLVICALVAIPCSVVSSKVLQKMICVALTLLFLPSNNRPSYTLKNGSIQCVIFCCRRGL
uniref:Uncharacterized protein n=2 Tax=Sus scrofa TaxID=9823 RepID=A0A8D1F8C2_PIG